MNDDVTVEAIRLAIRAELDRVGLRPAPPRVGGWIWDDASGAWVALREGTTNESHLPVPARDA
jgi:hypothetical protein